MAMQETEEGRLDRPEQKFDEALANAADLARRFQRQFSTPLAQLNSLLFEANEQGINVSIEIAQCEGYMSVLAIASGVATPAGQLLARRRRLIP
jgi:hypothetical protein